jgi:ribosomal protein S18 acetylase RimI-like enzyme
MNINIRHVKSNDYESIEDLGNTNYPDNYYESEETFISKIEGCREGCFVADVDGVVGYIVSFPYTVGKPFPINSFFEPIDDPNCWYIHDLCVSKDFRKHGVGKALAEEVLSKSWNVVCLTAVCNSENFWNKLGFRSFFQINYNGKNANYMILIK